MAISTSGTATVDQTALKVNQAGIIATLLLAFLLSPLVPALVGLVPALALVMLVGGVEPRLALFPQLYRRVLRPAGYLKPRVVRDSPRPHAFAQMVGGSVLVLASIAFAAQAPLIGWALAWVVIVLAFVNFAFNFCLGCQIFYRLERIGIVRA
ncbi:MAG TPA: DUF4395 domain-containing protein [Candidatus Limnocylindrales bacterium]|nr:DUF4395 domain-containing protein [Candidatus Limnocylindrales bacterium]